MNLFAYGTLMEPRLLERIIGSSPTSEAAALSGYQRFSFLHESYPGIVQTQKNDSVAGLLFFDLTDLSWKYLDGFEGSVYARVGVRVKTDSGNEYPAQTYIVREDYRHLLAATEWDFAEFLRRDLSAYLAED